MNMSFIRTSSAIQKFNKFKPHYKHLRVSTWLIGCYLIGLAIFIGIGRWDSIIYPRPLNPDEGQVAADMLRIHLLHGFSWDTIDGGTVGPLNSLVLGWPYLFGWDITFSTIRLTSLFLLEITTLVTYLTLSAASNRLLAVAYTLPLAVFFALTRTADFVHYSSEQLPLCLLMICLYLTLGLYRRTEQGIQLNSGSVFLLGTLLGAIPFCKLQATPIGISIGIFALYSISYKSNRKRTLLISILSVSTLLGCIVFLLPLALKGDLPNFYSSYILGALVYVEPVLSLHNLHTLLMVDNSLAHIYKMTLGLFIVLVLLLGFNAFKTRTRIDLILFLFSISCCAIFSVMRSGHLLAHYLMFLPTFFLLLVCAMGSIIQLDRPYRYTFELVSVSLIAICFIPVFKINLKSDVFHQYRTVVKSTFSHTNPQQLTWLQPKPDDTLYIWGWMAQWHVWSGLPSATRESVSAREILPSKLATYFKQRVIADLQIAQPTFFIDATHGDSFGFNQSNVNGLDSFPELKKVVDDNYSLLQSNNNNSSCAKIFVKREKAIELEKEIIPFQSIKASSEYSELYKGSHINDYSVTEDTCIDYWLLPNATLGSLKIQFFGKSRVNKLLILNTQHGSNINHATNEIKYIFQLHGKPIYSNKIKVNAYPKWTIATFNQPFYADSLIIDVLSYEGAGAGINEIKVYRDVGSKL